MPQRAKTGPERACSFFPVVSRFKPIKVLHGKAGKMHVSAMITTCGSKKPREVIRHNYLRSLPVADSGSYRRDLHKNFPWKAADSLRCSPSRLSKYPRVISSLRPGCRVFRYH